MKKPSITVVVTTYNRPLLCKRAVNSVKNQTYSNIKVVVVEDGSKSNLLEWLVENADSRFEYISHTNNRGLAAARNTGWQMHESDFYVFLDDDDFWHPHLLENLVSLSKQFAETPEVCTFYTNIQFTAADGKSGHAPDIKMGGIKEALFNNWSPPWTGMISRAGLVAINGFDESLKSCIDHDLYFKLANNNFHMVAINDSLVTKGNEATSRMTKTILKRLAGVKQFLNKWESYITHEKGKHFYEDYSRRYVTSEYDRFAYNEMYVGSRFRASLYYYQSWKYDLQNGAKLLKAITLFIGGKYLYTILKQYIGKIRSNG